MLHLNVGIPESLDAFFEELKRQVRLIGSESFTDALDEDGVVGWDAETSRLQQLTFDLQVKGLGQGTQQVVGG